MDHGTTLERRMLLRGAGVAGAAIAGVGAVPGSAAADGGDDESSGRLLGAWLITHTDDPPADPSTGRAVVTFAPGGAFAVQDFAPVSTGGLGAWKGYGDWFKVTFWSGQAGDTPQDHGVAIKVRVRGSRSYDSISGTYRVKVYDAVTHALVGSNTGTFTGERLYA